MLVSPLYNFNPRNCTVWKVVLISKQSSGDTGSIDCCHFLLSLKLSSTTTCMISSLHTDTGPPVSPRHDRLPSKLKSAKQEFVPCGTGVRRPSKKKAVASPLHMGYEKQRV
ncbi:hypothetical protein AVEN_35206-1 [Araneus ventricosus]|uniref:Uncharacterized protein n=1 Tax=Araneus ventricosus TaxID=182803 RepID=A0A4Y2SZD3_ARAVE|nr:hypothetical protein AVEN_35206-1 [Araneus ventricosus]